MALKPISLEQTERITTLVIGSAGMGKTSLIKTILGYSYEDGKWSKETEPQAGRVCVLSAESGLLSARDVIKAGQVEGFQIGSLADMKEAYALLSTDTQAQERYSWIFIDSLTEISSRCVEAMKGKYPDKADSFKLWGDYADTMTQLIKGFRDLHHYSVCFTCLDSIELDDMKRRYVAPAIAGTQIKERLTSYFDEVFYLTNFNNEDGTQYRAFVTQPWERYPAKDRSGMLDLIEKPNLEYIRRKILTDVPF